MDVLIWSLMHWPIWSSGYSLINHLLIYIYFFYFTLSGPPACVCVHVYLSTSVEDACIELTRAIEAGDMKAASVFAAKLSCQKAVLKIQPSLRQCEDTEIK